MCSIYLVLLQAPNGNYPAFVIKTGIIVILLSLFIISQAVLHRIKKNRLVQEKKLIQEHFDNQMMQYKIEIQEASFNSLGAELHDNVGQLLSTAKMFVGITERSLDNPPLTLMSANETLDRAIRELRDLSKSLNKEWLQQFDLYKNLQAEISRINAAGVLFIELSKRSPVLPAIAEQQFVFYRILQEGIQNVIKHAFATRLHIQIAYDENEIRASLEDNGLGFKTSELSTGLGIKIMKQRIQLLKGKINWRSSDKGTHIDISFPIKKPGL